MSWQAELIRLGTRLFLKRGTRAGVSIAERRLTIQAYERWVPRPPAGTESTERALGGVAAVRISRPCSQPGRYIFYLHGGGYVTGSPALYSHLTWRLAAAAEATLVAITYRLAPENPFPAAIDDAAAAWRALLAEGIDPQRCAIMGDSSGGGLALALALRLRDERGPLPAAIVALSPWTDLAMTGQSCNANATDPLMNFDDMEPLAAQCLDGADPRNPYASPLYGNPQGLPPTLLQVGSDEILLDDSKRMAQRMHDAGCNVTLEIWPRMPHVWQAFAPAMPEALSAIARIGAFVQEWAA